MLRDGRAWCRVPRPRIELPSRPSRQGGFAAAVLVPVVEWSCRDLGPGGNPPAAGVVADELDDEGAARVGEKDRQGVESTPGGERRAAEDSGDLRRAKAPLSETGRA